MLQAKDQRDVMEPNSDHRYYLSVEEHHLLNRQNRPCEVMETEVIILIYIYFQEMVNYNYQNCVLNSLIRKIGCKPFWLHSTSASESSSECQKAEDLIKFRQETSKTYHPVDQKSFYKKTGCLIPCKYKEYQIQFASKISNKRNNGFVY